MTTTNKTPSNITVNEEAFTFYVKLWEAGSKRRAYTSYSVKGGKGYGKDAFHKGGYIDLVSGEMVDFDSKDEQYLDWSGLTKESIIEHFSK